jgi:hypothetical protein
MNKILSSLHDIPDKYDVKFWNLFFSEKYIRHIKLLMTKHEKTDQYIKTFIVNSKPSSNFYYDTWEIGEPIERTTYDVEYSTHVKNCIMIMIGIINHKLILSNSPFRICIKGGTAINFSLSDTEYEYYTDDIDIEICSTDNVYRSSCRVFAFHFISLISFMFYNSESLSTIEQNKNDTIKHILKLSHYSHTTCKFKALCDISFNKLCLDNYNFKNIHQTIHKNDKHIYGSLSYLYTSRDFMIRHKIGSTYNMMYNYEYRNDYVITKFLVQLKLLLLSLKIDGSFTSVAMLKITESIKYGNIYTINGLVDNMINLDDSIYKSC